MSKSAWTGSTGIFGPAFSTAKTRARYRRPKATGWIWDPKASRILWAWCRHHTARVSCSWSVRNERESKGPRNSHFKKRWRPWVLFMSSPARGLRPWPGSPKVFELQVPFLHNPCQFFQGSHEYATRALAGQAPFWGYLFHSQGVVVVVAVTLPKDGPFTLY